MVEFKAMYFLEDWEETTCIELLRISQGTDEFWDFAIIVQCFFVTWILILTRRNCVTTSNQA
jgi:hypothetical protein